MRSEYGVYILVYNKIVYKDANRWESRSGSTYVMQTGWSQDQVPHMWCKQIGVKIRSHICGTWSYLQPVSINNYNIALKKSAKNGHFQSDAETFISAIFFPSMQWVNILQCTSSQRHRERRSTSRRNPVESRNISQVLVKISFDYNCTPMWQIFTKPPLCKSFIIFLQNDTSFIKVRWQIKKNYAK